AAGVRAVRRGAAIARAGDRGSRAARLGIALDAELDRCECSHRLPALSEALLLVGDPAPPALLRTASANGDGDPSMDRAALVWPGHVARARGRARPHDRGAHRAAR